MNVLVPQCESLVPCQPSVSERLNKQKTDLEQSLAKVNHALTLLNENPKLAELFDAISRV